MRKPWGYGADGTGRAEKLPVITPNDLLIPKSPYFLVWIVPIRQSSLRHLPPWKQRAGNLSLRTLMFVSGRAPGSPFPTWPKPLSTAEAEW